MGFALGSGGTISSWRWRAPTGITAGVLADTQTDIIRDENTATTTYHIAIPIAQLHGSGMTFSPGDPIGFTLLVNENDGAGRTGFMEFNQGIGSSKDATKFGDLYLLDGDFAKIQVKSAVKAVVTAAQQRTVTSIDTARNFLNLLLDNVAKSTLNAQLKGIIPQK
jgi:hypothetical protein